jgi:regulator of sirC expression with transglutaminase-like and TPR domain
MSFDPATEPAPLRAVVAGDQVTCSLEEAALHLARQEYPELDLSPWVGQIDRYAERIRSLLTEHPDAPEIIGAVNDVLFRELGFQGNTEDYYDPRNSFLNEVIARRTGIPITLSTLYMAVARRVGCEMHGTAFPGHFLVRASRPGWPIVVDPFHGGQVLSEAECRERLEQNASLRWDPMYVQPVPARAVLRRMLNNLRAIYLEQRDWKRLLRTVVQILVVTPEDHDEHFTLGVALAGTGRRADAMDALERFLALRPDTPQRGRAEKMLRELRARQS